MRALGTAVCASESRQIPTDDDVAIDDAAPECELGPGAGDLLAAPLAPGAGERAARLVEIQREAAGVQPQQREPARVLLAGGYLLECHGRRERADRVVVAVRVTGGVQEGTGRPGVLRQDRLHLRSLEGVARRGRER